MRILLFLFFIVIFHAFIQSDAQIISQSVTTVNGYASAPQTRGGSLLTFSDIIRQKTEGNQVQQVRC